jgi:NAD(P)-dependent dehydrogenase (short-subunit alcohol dehydrogenase family)
MKNKVCIITGANSGVGKQSAIGLAKLGAHVVMICRSKERGEVAKAEIAKKSGSDRIDLFIADLSEMGQVRTLASSLLSGLQSIDVLIHNAGLANAKRKLTKEGLETTLAVNQLAPFLLTHLLLKRLQDSAPARVVMVTSGMHGQGKIDFDDLQGERKYEGMAAYATSKLMNVMFTYSLARRLDGTGVTSNVVHPGFVNTGLLQQSSLPFRLMMKLMGNSVEKGARSTVFAASDPSMQTTTGAFVNRKLETKRSAAISYDEVIQERLWRRCMDLTGIQSSDSI